MRRIVALFTTLCTVTACGFSPDSTARTPPAMAIDARAEAGIGTGGRAPMTLSAADGTIFMYDDDNQVVELSGILSARGDVVVSTRSTGDADAATTMVEWRRVPTGELLAAQPIAGTLSATAVSSSAELVALSDATPGGRLAESDVAVVDRNRGRLAGWTLPGNLVPEAFTNAFASDGTGMPIGIFAIEYLKPDTYRVRVIDTATGVLGLPLNLRDKSQTVDEAMKAVSRTAVFEPVRQMLFTLYQGTDGTADGRYAFIHTLGLVNGVWCLEVPEQLDLGERTGAVAVDRYGYRLFVASPNGGIAGYSIDDITDFAADPVADVVADVGKQGGRVAIAVGSNEVVLAIDGTIIRLDPLTLAERDRFTWDMAVEALTVADNGDLFTVGSGRMTHISADHQLLAEWTLPVDVAEISRVRLVTG